jgi:hypothetical protein
MEIHAEREMMDVELVVGPTGIAIYMPPCKTVAWVGTVYF